MEDVKIFISRIKNKDLFNWAIRNRVPIKKSWDFRYYITAQDLIDYNCSIVNSIEGAIDYMDLKNAKLYSKKIKEYIVR